MTNNTKQPKQKPKGSLPPLISKLIGIAKGADPEDYRRYLEQKYQTQPEANDIEPT